MGDNAKFQIIGIISLLAGYILLAIVVSPWATLALFLAQMGNNIGQRKLEL